jgi:hypothetical protein
MDSTVSYLGPDRAPGNVTALSLVLNSRKNFDSTDWVGEIQGSAKDGLDLQLVVSAANKVHGKCARVEK